MRGANDFFPDHPLLIDDKSLGKSCYPVHLTDVVSHIIKDWHGNTEFFDKQLRIITGIPIEYREHLEFIFRHAV